MAGLSQNTHNNFIKNYNTKTNSHTLCNKNKKKVCKYRLQYNEIKTELLEFLIMTNPNNKQIIKNKFKI